MKAKLADLWSLPPGHRVVVVCNARGQPVRNEGRLLAQFLGSVARDGRICTLSHNDWRYVKKEAEEKILTAVKVLISCFSLFGLLNPCTSKQKVDDR